MTQVDYDSVAPEFDRRYVHNSYAGIERGLARFLASQRSIIEIGCGTGHWLAAFADAAPIVAGVDLSLGMLQRASVTAPRALLVRATAEQLPLAAGSFDRAFCVNALHHFRAQAAFLSECRRILRSGGAFLTIGLDPHTGLDQWWVYEYFPAALAADQQRYAPTERIREMLVAAGFSEPKTEIVHHVPATRPFEVALKQGILNRQSTSQLMVISAAEYEAGMRRLYADRPVLRSNLRLFATTAKVPSREPE